MVRFHILSPGFANQNGRAFLFPLIVHRKKLEAAGIFWKMFRSHEDPKLTDCDVLITDNKYFEYWWPKTPDRVFQAFEAFRKGADKIIYFDITDSAGALQTEIMPFVDKYCKNQLLKDKSAYLNPMYGFRAYTDYLHKSLGVVDSSPGFSTPVEDADLLGKLALGWNYGIADYSPWGIYRMALYAKLPLDILLSFPKAYSPPSINRRFDVCARMSTQYHRETVAWQRQRVQEMLSRFLDTAKLSRRKYYEELAQSKIVVSPFGWGEINLKDFEVFLTGGLLLKPDMSHMETWPDFFEDGKTMVSCSWDLENLESKLEAILGKYESYVKIAEAGQERYLSYLSGSRGFELFRRQLEKILKV